MSMCPDLNKDVDVVQLDRYSINQVLIARPDRLTDIDESIEQLEEEKTILTTGKGTSMIAQQEDDVPHFSVNSSRPTTKRSDTLTDVLDLYSIHLDRRKRRHSYETATSLNPLNASEGTNVKPHKRNSRSASVSTSTPTRSSHGPNTDWALDLIQGYNRNSTGFALPSRKNTSSLYEGANSNDVNSRKLEIEHLSMRPMIQTVEVHPEIDLVSTGHTLQILKIPTPPILHVVHAMSITGNEIKDDYEDLGDFVQTTDNTERRDTLTAEDLIAFEEVQEIRLNTDNWPLRDHFTSPVSAHSRSWLNDELSPVSPATVSPVESIEQLITEQPASTNMQEHPHPLRSHPTLIVDDRWVSSNDVSEVSEIAQLQQPNRKAFVMPNTMNKSTISLHSQSSSIDLRPSQQTWFAPSMTSLHPHKLSRRVSGRLPSAFNHSVRDLCQILCERIANDVQIHRRTSTATGVLTPVTEAFERLSTRKQSNSSFTHSRNNSTSNITHPPEKHKQKRQGFQGGLVGRGRRQPGILVE